MDNDTPNGSENRSPVASFPQGETFEKLLADYRLNGVDSEGHFTLNPARAREMLEQFQLPEPAYHALHLVSFLIGAGATSISVERQAGGLLFSAPGAQIPPEAMSEPFSALLKSKEEPYLGELALGLSAVLGQKVTVELSWGGTTAIYRPDAIELVEGSSLEMTIKVGRGGERELELIAQHFACSPIPIRLAGESVTAASSWGEATLQLILENPSYPLGPMTVAPIHIRKSTKARFSAVVRVGREASGVRVLHLGRLYTTELPWSCGLEGWQVEAFLNTDRLQKDLTQQSLLENQTLKNIFATLQQQLESALANLPLLVWRDHDAQCLWNSVIASLARARPKEAVERQSSFLRVLETAPTAVKANALFRLGLLQDLVKAGSGESCLREAEAMLTAEDAREALRIPIKARMDISKPTPEMEEAVSALVDDIRATEEDRLEALRWLRAFSAITARQRSLYTVKLAHQLNLLGRSGLALQELDSWESEISVDQLLLAQSLEIRSAALADLGHYPKALESLGRLLSLQREEHGQYSLKLGLTLTQMATLLEHLGKAKQAKEYREWSRRLHE